MMRSNVMDEQGELVGHRLGRQLLKHSVCA
jgi:hypothetical protein